MALIPCPVCGAQISSTATTCPKCGAELGGEPVSETSDVSSEPKPVPPESHLAFTIVSTVLFGYLGIPGIVYAARVKFLCLQNRYEEAAYASRKAKKWAIINIIVGCVLFVLVILIYVLYFAALYALINS